MKKIINICSLCLISICLSTASAFGQAVFNDTIFFKITGIEQLTNGFKYFLEFETQGTGQGNQDSFKGIGLLSMCSCYCDSIWDAWPTSPPSDSLFGGIGVLTYPSTASSGGDTGLFKSSSSGGRQRGRLGVLQMPGSFLRQDPFPLQITYKKI